MSWITIVIYGVGLHIIVVLLLLRLFFVFILTVLLLGGLVVTRYFLFLWTLSIFTRSNCLLLILGILVLLWSKLGCGRVRNFDGKRWKLEFGSDHQHFLCVTAELLRLTWGILRVLFLWVILTFWHELVAIHWWVQQVVKTYWSSQLWVGGDIDRYYASYRVARWYLYHFWQDWQTILLTLWLESCCFWYEFPNL